MNVKYTPFFLLKLCNNKYATTAKNETHYYLVYVHSLSGEYEGCFAVKLTGNFRLVFKAYTCEEEFTTQKSNTEIIVIEEVVDYHGK